MNKKTIIYVVVALLIFSGISTAMTYNGLVKKEEVVKVKWAEVQNAYQRRLDLVPNLVNVVKGGAAYESDVLKNIAAARASAANGATTGGIAAVENAQNAVATSTNRLLITVENYPELQGTKAFLQLQTQLEGTERRIKFARQYFNEALQDYNTSVRSFPRSLVAGSLGFEPRQGFTADAGADKAVEINFQKK